MRRFLAYLMNYQTTAAEDVAQVLSGFDALVEQLYAAANKAVAEIVASWERDEEIREMFEAMLEHEKQARDAARIAEERARRAANWISTLVGEDA
jgi:erythromycin esterase-like protein